MELCNGRGSCIQQCFGRSHRNHTKLIGGTREYDIYCKKECTHNCQLVECHNFRMCGKKYPQQVLDAHNGMCVNCAVTFGKVKFLDEQGDCPICMENKEMIQISCEKHKLCIDCWINMSENRTDVPLRCPLCRESIWKRKEH